MKRILALLTAVFLLLCLAACGQPADHAPEQSPQQAEPSEPPAQTEPPPWKARPSPSFPQRMPVWQRAAMTLTGRRTPWRRSYSCPPAPSRTSTISS